MSCRKGLLLVALLAAAYPSVSFAANLLTNGSFENGSYTWDGNVAQSLYPGSTVMTGWTETTAELAVIGPANHFGIAAHDGEICLDLCGYHDSPPFGGVTRDVATSPGALYRLSYWIGAFGVGTQAQVTATAGSTSAVGTGPVTPENTNVTWTLATLDFTATSSLTTISLVGAQSSNGGNFLGLDDVSLEQLSGGPLPGDANLNGRIDPDDFALTDRGYAKHLTGWSNGDFNGDGTVDAADYQIIDTSYAQGAHAPLLSAVPEPSALAYVVAAAALARRHLRRAK